MTPDEEPAPEIVAPETGMPETGAPETGAPDETFVLDDRTVVVDETVVVERDATVVVHRDPPPGLELVDAAPGALPEAPGAPAPAPARRGAARRTRIALPDETPASTRAVEGQGVGPLDRYVPRQIPQAPVLERLPEGPDATRAVAPSMPSVARASRRAGWRALVLAVAACVVAVGGLVLIVLALV